MGVERTKSVPIEPPCWVADLMENSICSMVLLSVKAAATFQRPELRLTRNISDHDALALLDPRCAPSGS